MKIGLLFGPCVKDILLDKVKDKDIGCIFVDGSFSWNSHPDDFQGILQDWLQLKGFNEDEAMQMFDELDRLSGSTLHWGGSVDEEVEYPYNELSLCYKCKFSNLEESQASFWYEKNNIADAEDFLQYLDIEAVSGVVPGNMSFISYSKLVNEIFG